MNNSMAAAHAAPRCGAKNRQGRPCRCPALRGKRRCRLHGGLSTGPPTGPRHPGYRHGHCTKAAIEERRLLRQLLQATHATIADMVERM